MKRAAIAWFLLLSGCTTIQPILRTAELVVYPKLGNHSQSILVPNTLASIATLDIVPCLQTSPGVFSAISSITGSPVALDDPNVLKLSMASPSIDPSRPFIFRKLRPNSTYRIFGKAYNTGNSLISQDSTSYTDVVLTNNDTPTMATLPINLLNTPFGASTSVTINTDGRYDYLKTTLYLVSNNSQVMVSQTSRNNPIVSFDNLQNNTSYKLVAEAYKLGGMMASSSLTLNITNDNAPATTSLSLTIPYYMSTIAGNGTASFSGDGGPAANATFNRPICVAVDSLGNLYVAEYINNRVRKISSDGMISTVAGNGATSSSGDGGPATNAGIPNPSSVAVDPAGNLYVTEYGNHRVRKIATNGTISTFAGNGTANFSGDGGPATSACLNGPSRLTADGAGNLYISETGSHRVRKVTSDGTITTIAGNGGTSYSGDGVQATNTSLQSPFGVALDQAGNIYIADCWSYRIRKVAPNGIISTFAGIGSAGYSGDGGPATAARLAPSGVMTDPDGNLYATDFGNECIRKIAPNGVITTIAGVGSIGYSGDGGLATNAALHDPHYTAMDAFGNIYIADDGNHRVRKLR